MDSKKYIGMDAHQATISVAVMDSGGKVVMDSVAARPGETTRHQSCGLRSAEKRAAQSGQQE